MKEDIERLLRHLKNRVVRNCLYYGKYAVFYNVTILEYRSNLF